MSQLFMVVSQVLASDLPVTGAATAGSSQLVISSLPSMKVRPKEDVPRQEFLPMVRAWPDLVVERRRVLEGRRLRDLMPIAEFPSPVAAEQIGLLGPADGPRILLPDLRTLPPTDFRLVNLPSSGQRLVRFSNHIWNAGPGKLELHGGAGTNSDDHEHAAGEGGQTGDLDAEPHEHAPDEIAEAPQDTNGAEPTHTVYQHIFDENGALALESYVGEYVYHAAHAHWHLNGFAVYEVWSIDETGGLIELLATSGKISYCVTDTRTVDRDLAGDVPFPRQGYGACYRDVQGLSVNWVDTYAFHLPQQWVNVTDLPEGLYALVSTADSADDIVEADERNNGNTVYFKLEQYRVSVISLANLVAATHP